MNRNNLTNGLGSVEPRERLTSSHADLDVKSESESYEVANDNIGYMSTQDIGVDQASNSSAREITIRPLHSGYLVNVGCQQVAVETVDTLIKHLGAYLKHPSRYETKWFNTGGQNKLNDNNVGDN